MPRPLYCQPPNVWCTPEHKKWIKLLGDLPLAALVHRATGSHDTSPENVALALRLTMIKSEDRGNSYRHLNEDAGDALHIAHAEVAELKKKLIEAGVA
jgi:hypothetical protein